MRCQAYASDAFNGQRKTPPDAYARSDQGTLCPRLLQSPNGRHRKPRSYASTMRCNISRDCRTLQRFDESIAGAIAVVRNDSYKGCRHEYYGLLDADEEI